MPQDSMDTGQAAHEAQVKPTRDPSVQRFNGRCGTGSVFLFAIQATSGYDNAMSDEEFYCDVTFSVSAGLVPWGDPSEFVHTVTGRALDLDEVHIGTVNPIPAFVGYTFPSVDQCVRQTRMLPDSTTTTIPLLTTIWREGGLSDRHSDNYDFVRTRGNRTHFPRTAPCIG